MLYRAACICKDGRVYSKDGTREEIDEFLLELDNRLGWKRYRVMNLETKEIFDKFPK